MGPVKTQCYKKRPGTYSWMSLVAMLCFSRSSQYMLGAMTEKVHLSVCLWLLSPTWRRCGAQCRPSTIALMPDGWAAWSLWCSQTVHTEQWGRQVEVLKDKERRWRREGEWKERGGIWRDGGRVNCVYSAAMVKSMLSCLLVEIYSCIFHSLFR